MLKFRGNFCRTLELHGHETNDANDAKSKMNKRLKQVLHTNKEFAITSLDIKPSATIHYQRLFEQKDANKNFFNSENYSGRRNASNIP